MSKGRKTRSSHGPSWTHRMVGSLRRISWRAVLHGVFNVLVITGLGAGVCFGMPFLDRFVNGLPEYHRPLDIRLVELPEWLEANPHVPQRIIEFIGLEPRDQRLDQGLAQRLGRRLSANGWVRRVKQVNVGSDDVIRIQCDYREPVAWVMHAGCYYLVDAEAVRLPGRYSPDEVSRDGGLLVVSGVKMPAPDDGRVWEGADLRVGLQMVALLRDRTYRNQIAEVVVENYGGRRDRRRSHIELMTDSGSRIRWGRAPGEEIDEPTAEQKLAQLQGLWRDYHRVDMGRAWVDVQVWPDQVSVPTCGWQDGVKQRS